MVDMHVHLLSNRVKFERFYDKLAIMFFARRLGANPRRLLKNSYEEYVDTLIRLVRTSKSVKRIALFGIDDKIDESGKLLHQDNTVCASNEDVLAIYEKHPDIIIPFFSINPLRSDALELIEKYAPKGFKGAKFMQNYWEIDTNDEKFIPYYEKLKEKGLPALFHIGSESSLPSNRAYESLKMTELPLKLGVKVIAAHMALSYEPLKILRAFRRNPKYYPEEYFTLIEMLKTHDNLYADISAILTPVRAKVLRRLSREKEIHHKLLYASDYPVPFSVMLNSYDMPFLKRVKLVAQKNPFDRYAQAISEYFPRDSLIYTNYKNVLGV
ncbi:MAG: amidohydrolase family protein [Campylobacteraceae bacterium]|jgi:predicted TIM-barrel fold metal-dependent hydrolase|nr:amidohydrolase family protein [Campylobacteraceae bacterium]